MTMMTLRMSLCQRSKSAGDGHRNLVNLIAPEPLKGFASKLIHEYRHEPVRFLKSRLQRSKSHKRFSADECNDGNFVKCSPIFEILSPPV